LISKDKKKAKRALKGSYEGNKLCILDEAKHNRENFGILHFIVSK
jgi:hypothetical protein